MVDVNPNNKFELSKLNKEWNCFVIIVYIGDNKTSDKLLTPKYAKI